MVGQKNTGISGRLNQLQPPLLDTVGSIASFADVNEILFHEEAINHARLHRGDTFQQERIGSIHGSARSFHSISFAGAVEHNPATLNTFPSGSSVCLRSNFHRERRVTRSLPILTSFLQPRPDNSPFPARSCVILPTLSIADKPSRAIDFPFVNPPPSLYPPLVSLSVVFEAISPPMTSLPPCPSGKIRVIDII